MAILHMQLSEIAKLEWADMVWYHERGRLYMEAAREFNAYAEHTIAPSYEPWEE